MAEKITVKTGSQNTIKAYEFLKANAGQEFTYAEIAAEVSPDDPRVAKVLGGVNSLMKKGIVTNGDPKEISDKEYKTIVVNPDFEVEFEFNAPGDKGKLTEKAVQVLQFLQGQGRDVEMTAAEVAEEIDWQPIAVNGVVNGLVKRGLAQREAVIVEMPEGKEKEVKVVVLTDEGFNYKF